MKETYTKCAGVFKALSDENRLQIVEMLTDGELCACRILDRFNITQPTLSHHMKILCASGLVKGRKQGKWTYYSISKEGRKKTIAFLRKLTTETTSEAKKTEPEPAAGRVSACEGYPVGCCK